MRTKSKIHRSKKMKKKLQNRGIEKEKNSDSEINPSLLDRGELESDKGGTTFSKGHQPYEF